MSYVVYPDELNHSQESGPPTTNTTLSRLRGTMANPKTYLSEERNKAMRLMTEQYAMHNNTHKWMMERTINDIEKLEHTRKKNKEERKRKWEQELEILRQKKQAQIEAYQKAQKEVPEHSLYEEIENLVPIQEEIDANDETDNSPEKSPPENQQEDPVPEYQEERAPMYESQPIPEEIKPDLEQDPEPRVTEIRPQKNKQSMTQGMAFQRKVFPKKEMSRTAKTATQKTISTKMAERATAPSANSTTITSGISMRKPLWHKIDIMKENKKKNREKERDEYYQIMDQMDRKFGRRDSSDSESEQVPQFSQPITVAPTIINPYGPQPGVPYIAAYDSNGYPIYNIMPMTQSNIYNYPQFNNLYQVQDPFQAPFQNQPPNLSTVQEESFNKNNTSQYKTQQNNQQNDFAFITQSGDLTNFYQQHPRFQPQPLISQSTTLQPSQNIPSQNPSKSTSSKTNELSLPQIHQNFTRDPISQKIASGQTLISQQNKPKLLLKPHPRNSANSNPLTTTSRRDPENLPKSEPPSFYASDNAKAIKVNQFNLSQFQSQSDPQNNLNISSDQNQAFSKYQTISNPPTNKPIVPTHHLSNSFSNPTFIQPKVTVSFPEDKLLVLKNQPQTFQPKPVSTFSAQYPLPLMQSNRMNNNYQTLPNPQFYPNQQNFQNYPNYPNYPNFQNLQNSAFQPLSVSQKIINQENPHFSALSQQQPLDQSQVGQGQLSPIKGDKDKEDLDFSRQLIQEYKDSQQRSMMENSKISDGGGVGRYNSYAARKVMKKEEEKKIKILQERATKKVKEPRKPLYEKKKKEEENNVVIRLNAELTNLLLADDEFQLKEFF